MSSTFARNYSLDVASALNTIAHDDCGKGLTFPARDADLAFGLVDAIWDHGCTVMSLLSAASRDSRAQYRRVERLMNAAMERVEIVERARGNDIG